MVKVSGLPLELKLVRTPANLASQILYLITTLGKSLTGHFPGVVIKQRVWSVRLGFSRSSMQRDLSMPQCIPLTLLEREGFWIPAGVGRSRKFGGVGPD